MLPRLRRSAGLLLVLFVGHLGMVTSGAVCTTPGMAAMSATSSAGDAPMADMAMTEAATEHAGASSELATSDHAPCSVPAQGTCVTGTACVTALGAARAEGFATSDLSSAAGAMALIVTMPITSGAAPDLPPPRA